MSPAPAPGGSGIAAPIAQSAVVHLAELPTPLDHVAGVAGESAAGVPAWAVAPTQVSDDYAVDESSDESQSVAVFSR